MICKKCNNTGVLNSANNKEFYYCRVCKEEIFLDESEEKQLSQQEISEIFYDFYYLADKGD
jgi:hypothetical protein